MTKKNQQKKILKKKSNDIAAAAGTLFTPGPTSSGLLWFLFYHDVMCVFPKLTSGERAYHVL